ncbi:MAG: hypothetical protein ACM3JD_03795 [Rudaea sp.]
MAAVTPVPATARPDAGFAEFAKKLKTALESNDVQSVTPLISPEFSVGVWRSQGNIFHNTADALKGLEPLWTGARVVVDLDRVPVEPIVQSPPEVRILVARWGDSFAHLVTRQQDGEWKWSGVLAGVDYYHSPTIMMLRAEPRAYAGRDVMLRGDVSDQASNGAGPEPAGMVNDPFAFVLKDASGGAVWVQISRDALKNLGLAEESIKAGTRVRAIGITQESDGKPVLVADSVQLIKPGEYISLRGVIADYSASARTFTVEGSPVQVALLETTTQDYANGKPIRAVPLGKGVNVLVVGRPGPGNVLQAEAIYIYL